ncbi:GntR family transcriptional regulator [Kutzneria buriramensis]|uniref:DNA-binding GntR family transcriptional regulator n=1 Tax=Kutzneria buriramensis TaxID=1045776 RepID=A0A3E0HZV8_9PSEU|nr:GntR family transcriptional regulator [Kutzneria buriramensis]REH51816.1 DNA-binding GntR family transcriptional regulator [Kutzneria buriramensis]
MMVDLVHTGLAGQAVAVLRELVLTGEIAAGERVNEVGVAQRLGISRGPLREAIRHLASEGLLVLTPNRGAHVPVTDNDGVRALFELRSALESAAARLAAERRTDADLAAMKEASAASREAFATGEFPYRLDLAFHRTLLDAARSPLVAEQVRLAQQRVILLRATKEVAFSHERASLDDHDALIEAITAHDGDRAGQVMAAHLARVRDQLLTTS